MLKFKRAKSISIGFQMFLEKKKRKKIKNIKLIIERKYVSQKRKKGNENALIGIEF
jgi:hypothetical protein